MRVTIIKDDNLVAIDGEARHVDCSDLPANFHALQWHDTHGEVEYAAKRCDHCGVKSKRGNDILSSIADYQMYVDLWHAAEPRETDAA